MLLLGAAAFVAGDCTRTGVPARPSSPDMPVSGSFWADAGAVPSKSISSKFSTLFCVWGGGVVPVTAAAAAAAAKGFSWAFWICSLLQSANVIKTRRIGKHELNSGPLHSVSTKPALPDELLRRLVVDRCQRGQFIEELFKECRR